MSGGGRADGIGSGSAGLLDLRCRKDLTIDTEGRLCYTEEKEEKR